MKDVIQNSYQTGCYENPPCSVEVVDGKLASAVQFSIGQSYAEPLQNFLAPLSLTKNVILQIALSIM